MAEKKDNFASQEVEMQSLEEEVEQARNRLKQAALNIDPLRVVRKHPVWSVGCAFLGGFCFGALNRSLQVASIVPLALQTGKLALKIVSSSKD